VVAYKNVCTVAMTNYPWQLDAAFVRRFSNRIFVDLPGDTHIVELIHSTLSRHVRTVLTGAQHDYQRYCARLASSKRSRLERLKDEMDASMKRCQDECTADDKRPDADGHYLWQRSTIVRHYLRQVTDVTLATYAAKLKERLYSNSDIVAWMNNVFMQMADDALMCNTFVRLEGTALAQLKQSFGDALRLDGTTGDGRDGLSHLYVSTLCFEDDELAGMDDKIYVAEQTVSESAYQFDTSDPDLEHLDPAGLHIEKGTYQFWQTSTDCYLRITDRRIRNLYVLRRDGDYDMIWAFDFSLAVGDTASTTEPEVHQKRLWLRSIVPSVTWGQSFGRLLATFGTLFGGEGPAVVAGTTAIARHDTHIQLLLDNLKQVFARVDHMNDAGEYALLAVGSSEKSTLQQIVTSGTASVPRAVFQQSAGKSLLHLLLGNKTYQPCTWVSQPGRLLKTLAADEHTLMVTLFCDASHFERALAEVPSSGNKHMIDEIRRYAKDPSTFTFQAPPKKKE
jgi:SpoVK/Ycf46/Vps4 family AAA+-type ATPase